MSSQETTSPAVEFESTERDLIDVTDVAVSDLESFVRRWFGSQPVYLEEVDGRVYAVADE